MSTAVPQDFAKERPASRSNSDVFRQVIAAAGSLKVTCTLFVMGMFIIFVGSLAQSRRDVWQVVNQYFRVYVAKVEVRDFFPPSMFPGWLDFDWNGELGMFASFPFPGGWLIGWLLLGNLLAAHVARIRIQAKGMKLLFGLLSLAVGFMLMTLIVVVGNQQTGVEQANTLLSPEQIWRLMLGTLLAAVFGLTAQGIVGQSKSRAEKYVLFGIAASCAAVLIFFVVSGPVNLSSMRILWQLMKAGVCSLILLIGCQLLFQKRGGIVLLHTGVAILMISELVVGLYGHESLMMIVEGESASFARDIREVELAVVSPEDDKDSVVVVPETMLLESEADSQAENHDDAIISLAGSAVPFDLRITQFYRNCQLRSAEPDDELTESGFGSFAVPVELDPVDGMNDETDTSAAYVEIIDRSSKKPVRTLLTSLDLSESRSVVLPERVTVDDKEWNLVLRFRRNYRPYSVKLLDVQRDVYVGSSTPRNFQSNVIITDSDTGQSEEFTLWMNNPLRYRGETFYQSGYHPLPSGGEATTLQLVRNSGWMLPYIGCIVVAFGMFAQFWITLRRFLARKASPSAKTADVVVAQTPQRSRAAFWVPVGVALVCVAWLGSKARTPRPDADAMNLYEFAELPVAGGGRTQPVDSWARNQLILTSHKSTFYGELTEPELDQQREELIESIRKSWPDVNFDSLKTFNGEYEDWIAEISRLTSSGEDAVEARVRDRMTAKMSAVRWFLDMVARPDRAVRHRVIRLDNDQVLSLLGLKQREKLVYSPMEIEPKLSNLEQIDKDARELMQKNQDNRLTPLQRRVMALYNTIRRLDTMQQVFQVAEEDSLLPSLVETWRIMKRLEGAPVPMGIATGIDDAQAAWETVRSGSLARSCREQMLKHDISNREELENWISSGLPKETLLSSLESTYEILQEAAAERTKAGDETTAALLAARLIPEADSRFEREVFSLIASADADQPMSKVVSNMDEARLREIASERITRDLFDVFRTLEDDPSDKRLETVRSRLQQVQRENPDEAALGEAMNQELMTILLDDLSQRAGTLIYPSAESPVFIASTDGMQGALQAWSDGDVNAFNQSVASWHQYLSDTEVPQINTETGRLEAFFNRFDPFGQAIYLYLPAMLLSFLGWLVWPQTMRNTAFAMVVVAFVVHTVALLLRIEISGRPPVTSLYSSAIFIGWAIVAGALVIERLAGFGIGNIVAASVGSATLMIAHYLARDEGDTFSVMQAVLDTTFWLATHVVCISLGYGATFLAGALGLCYVFLSLRASRTKTSGAGAPDLTFLGKAVYGIVCFALFFSLVGTVLGGLWADDSWGRFWGWDPKENGALIIVIWNALILHARWDKMVRDYGTAVLAMVGNVVTAWSWFGVNELRAGLHSYGFTEGRMGMLVAFIEVQLVIVVLATLIRPQANRPAA